ncbi:hypothetical protein [Lapillicoccus jejuensis]|uniref:Dolichyl-phosphate-mannose-protein mannosyltransferase n=1 Tax=Lapillicoccus jejuensis TaxID=402171 RepID=A0A542E2K2_9MICO|nr:hypothetical protein [Lapillicoccus jejuensis]TQJ09545.1 hypothetical protein FB458_2657 [Lapillicoccus jejuensis]
MRWPARVWRPPAARLAAGVAGATAVALLVLRPVSDPSPWLHLRVGELLAGGGRFGLPDPLTPSADRAYSPTQWLPSVVGYELVRVLGVPAVAWMRVVAVLALLVVLLATLRHRVAPRRALLGGLVGTLLVVPAMTERPQTLGLVLLALQVHGWTRSGEDGRRRWWLVPLAWVFAATHGLWTVGLVAAAAVLAGVLLDGGTGGGTVGDGRARVRHLAPVLLLQGLVTLATPLGPALLLTPFAVGGNGRRFVVEWQPGTLADPAVATLLVLVAALAVVALRRGRRLRRSELLLLAVGLLLAVSAVRTAAPGLLVALPVLADHLLAPSGTAGAGGPRPSALPLAGALVAATVAALVALPVARVVAAVPRVVPAGLAAPVAALPAGTVVLAQTDVSGWLLWTAPQVRPVVDLRAESFSADHLQRFVATYQARPGWEALVDSSGASYALLPRDAPVAGALLDVRHWRVDREADGYLLLARGAR